MNKTRQLILTALMASITTVGAQIVIPIGTVPVTLQTFAVFLSGMVLGPVCGAISQMAYLLLGLFGLPVFAMFSSGLGILAGPTGGFLLAFPFVAFLSGIDRGQSKYFFRLCALLILYIFGWIRLSFFTGNLLTAFFTGVLPFIGFDLLKVWGAGLVHKHLKNRLLFLD